MPRAMLRRGGGGGGRHGAPGRADACMRHTPPVGVWPAAVPHLRTMGSSLFGSRRCVPPCPLWISTSSVPLRHAGHAGAVRHAATGPAMVVETVQGHDSGHISHGLQARAWPWLGGPRAVCATPLTAGTAPSPKRGRSRGSRGRAGQQCCRARLDTGRREQAAGRRGAVAAQLRPGVPPRLHPPALHVERLTLAASSLTTMQVHPHNAGSFPPPPLPLHHAHSPQCKFISTSTRLRVRLTATGVSRSHAAYTDPSAAGAGCQACGTTRAATRAAGGRQGSRGMGGRGPAPA